MISKDYCLHLTERCLWVWVEITKRQTTAVSVVQKEAQVAGLSLGAQDAIDVQDSSLLPSSSGWLSGTLQLSQSLLSLPSLLQPRYLLFTIICLLELSAPSCSPDFSFGPRCNCWVFHGSGCFCSPCNQISPLYQGWKTKTKHPTTGCAYNGASLLAGHTAQEEGSSHCCLRVTGLLFA